MNFGLNIMLAHSHQIILYPFRKGIKGRTTTKNETEPSVLPKPGD